VLSAIPAVSQQSFEEWKAEQEQAFEEFLSEEDAAFSAFLAREWEAFQAHLSEGFYAEPKLVEPPTTNRAAVPGRGSVRSTTPPEPAPAEEPRITGRRIELTFHGVRIELRLPGEIESLSLTELSPEGFSRYWKDAAAGGTAELVEDLKRLARERNFNDYTYFRLVLALTEAIFEDSRDATAAAWYVMVTSGYDLRIAYGDEQIALLMPSEHTLYGVSFFRGSDRLYYLLGPDGSAVRTQARWRTYRGNHADAQRTVSLTMPPEVNLPERTRTEELSFSYDGRKHAIEIPVNEHVVSLFRDYPFTDWYVHFSPAVSGSARTAVVEQLGRLVRGRNPADAANLLLRFVQTAFPYQTDQEHFGFEKWQAPEEILYYRLSDCDDRSVLYAFLLQEVLGWDEVAVLHYPGHLAVAVAQSRLGADGDAVLHNGVRYIVTDPTYIGADIGMAMPQYRDVTPTVHLLSERPGLSTER
jgi:hypothetical protein